MVRKIIASITIITLIVAPAYARANTTNTQSKNSANSKNYTLRGKLTLITSRGLGSESECKGQRGFNDIYGGQQIIVKNGKGEIIAVGSLGAGVRDQEYPEVGCHLPIIVDNVPNSDFYQIEIGSGRRGFLTYSEKELENKEWSVDIILSSK